MTREQKRASLVYDRVNRYENDEHTRGDYGSMAHRFPALLRSAGLIQALAFVESRGNEAHRQFIYDFASVLTELGGAKQSEKAASTYGSLFEKAREADLPEYLRMTREALAVADWFKRFAQSVLKVAPGRTEP